MSIDTAAQIASVDRAVATDERNGEPSRVQNLAQTYPAAIDELWDAVTTDRISRWFLPISGDLKLGGRYQLEGNAGGTVTACDPPADGVAGYAITWEFGGGVTWVTVRLESVDADHTRLELEHVAPVSQVPDELWAQFGPGGTGIGWDSGLLGLSLHLSDPSARPEDTVAWTMSPEGKSFMRGSADAWAAAQVADGSAPDAAQSAADAVYAMYVGEAPAPM